MSTPHLRSRRSASYGHREELRCDAGNSTRSRRARIAFVAHAPYTKHSTAITTCLSRQLGICIALCSAASFQRISASAGKADFLLADLVRAGGGSAQQCGMGLPAAHRHPSTRIEPHRRWSPFSALCKRRPLVRNRITHHGTTRLLTYPHPAPLLPNG
ncbi:unnamed protein product [Rangifer tarandus platyrhynchus]|uniref:Uncharacterized protein n=1 Tax=Rangifer tarandus platyrhynchus TaxID=3082113 RepID=A0ABN8XJB1_RANTA|nr:unnamed protein product [Rangifer tarandus platyrhynchus]